MESLVARSPCCFRKQHLMCLIFCDSRPQVLIVVAVAVVAVAAVLVVAGNTDQSAATDDDYQCRCSERWPGCEMKQKWQVPLLVFDFLACWGRWGL